MPYSMRRNPDEWFEVVNECRRTGYHSIFHQLYNMKVCPFHNMPLEYDRPDLKFDISYCKESIKYEKDYESLANARNIPHPSLRTEDVAVKCFVFKTHKMANYILAHIYFSVHEGIGENMHFRKETVFPYEFFSDIESYKCFRIKYFEGTDKELLACLQTNNHPLLAIRTFEKANSIKCTLMVYWHGIYRQITFLEMTCIFIVCLIIGQVLYCV